MGGERRTVKLGDYGWGGGGAKFENDNSEAEEGVGGG